METSNVHHQAMASHLDETLNCPKSQQQQQEQKKARPQPEQALKCPRCDSTNTKFCYYNNYSLTQPRYFCKGCRRYWTKGGSLRNVPVGGGCRKNHKRSSSSSNSSSSSSKRSTDLDLAVAVPNPTPLLPPLPLPPLSFDPADLTLAFASDSFMLANTTPGTSASVSGFLDILRGGGGGGGGNNLSSYYGFGGIDRSMDQVESGAVANTNAGTVDAGAGLMMFPNFDGGLLNGSASGSSACTESVTATTEMDHSGAAINVDVEGENSNTNSSSNEVAMGMGMHPWPVVDYGNLGLDSARDAHYWNGVGAAAAPWHGLINSSLM